jgi:hypothetical protein
VARLRDRRSRRDAERARPVLRTGT